MDHEKAAGQTEQTQTKQPNSRHCFVCGLENEYGLGMSFYEIGPGEVVVEHVVPDQYQGYPGVVHGGVVAAMLDEVLGRAAMVGEHSHFRLTAKLTIRYRKPVPTGELLRLHGNLLRERGRLAFAHAELRLQDGTLAAEADGVLADLPELPVEEEELERLGWKVYPD